MALKMEVGLAAVLVTMLFVGTTSQSGCTNVLISLSPCLNYITGNSSTPSPPCCSQLQTVVGSQPQCLCAALNMGGAQLGLNINQTLALQLPKACNVQTPPISRCNAGSPAGAPTGSTDIPSSSVPGDGSKNTPPNNTSDGSLSTMSFSLLLSLLLLVSYAST